MDREKKPEFLVICRTITGTIKQQCSNQRFVATNFVDELKQICDFLWREVNASFGNSCDEHNLELNRFYQELAYGILAELVLHVLKMDIETDGEFSNMYTMVMDIFCHLSAVCSVELMPYLFSTFASLLLYFNEQQSSTSSQLQEDVKQQLCYYMFPLCLAHHRSEESFCDSMVPSILSSVLDTCDEDSSWCTQVVDSLMLLKRDICLDILSLISSGTEHVRKQAKKILMHYWLKMDGRVEGEEPLKGWTPPRCGESGCKDVAELVCINPACEIHSKSAKAMYHHLCKSCDTGACDDHLFSIARPLGTQDCLSGSCQLESCHETAVLACFHTNCISLVKSTQPFVRMCSTCAAKHHANIDSHHIYQDGLQCPWTCENRLASVAFLGALSKLLEDMLNADLSKQTLQDNQDNMAAVILLDQYCQYPIRPPDDYMHHWMVRLVSMVLNWLYNMAQSGQQQTSDAGKRVMSWLTRVLNQDAEYIAEALLPNLPDYAQVGSLWESNHSIIDRRKHTLGIIEMLQSQLLTDKEADEFYLVFDIIMPRWLKELNSSLDQLESLQDSFKKLFQVGSESVQRERRRKFGFIKNVFDEDDGEKTREALSWLQVLTKMNISIPFIRHIIEKVVRKPGRSKMSSFDIETSKSRPVLRRRSSLSDSEFSDSSVGGLMTQSSFEYVGEVLDVNSTLTRYILMLDIWLSQIRVVEDSVNFQFSVIQSIVLNMLKESSSWGSLHNHDRPSEICLLCHAIMLWFNLANLIFENYTLQEAVVQSLDEEEEAVAMTHRPSRQSFFNKRFLINFKRSRAQHVMQEDCPEGRVSMGSEGSSAEQEGRISGAGATTRANTLSPVYMDSPKMLLRERKIARMDTHRNYVYTSLIPDESGPKPKTSEKDTGTLYQIFQQCLRLWDHRKLHTFIPEVTHQIILFVTTLFQHNKLLQDEASFSIYIQDVEKLIINLWSSLVCESSYLAKAAVTLLIICLELLAMSTDEQAKETDLQQTIFRSMVDSKFEQDSYTKRFEVVEKAFLMVQFLDDVKLSVQTHLSLSCVFCHLVGSLQDSSSYVATRAEYCLQALKPSAIEAIQQAMTSAFNNYSEYRSLILMTFSMLNSTLPNIPASPIRFFVSLSPYYTLLDLSHALDEDVHTVQKKHKKARGQSVTADKISLTSHYSLEALHKYLKMDPSNSAILQQMLALMLQILANPSFKSSLLNDTIEVPAMIVTHVPKASVLILSFFQLVVCHHFLTQPEQLRESHFFETYLRNIYQVLDVNTEFGNSPEVLLFNMQLLIFSACPDAYKHDAFLKSIKDKPSKNNISLALLDPNLRPAWLKVFFVICYKYTDLIFQSNESLKLKERVQGCLEISLKTLESVPHHCIPPPQMQTSSSAATNQDHASLMFSAMSSRNTSVASFDSCSPLPVNTKQLDANKCPLCQSLVNTFSEETITHCIITVSTALHHMPIVTSVYLSRVIKALGRVAIPDYFSWENFKNKNSNPTAVSNVAKQYLKCLLTQFGDRKLFLYLFKFSITDNNNKALMQAIATSLPTSMEQDKSVSQGEEENKTDKPVLTQLSPVQYFLEDLPEDTNILQKSDVIVNLSNYLELLKDGRNNLSSLLTSFDFFFEKVKELPKSAVNKKSFTSLLHIMIFVTNILTDSPPKHTSVTLSVLQHQLSTQFWDILMMGLKRTLVPLHALVVFCSSWHRLADPPSSSFPPLDNLIKMLSIELIQGLKMKPTYSINLANFIILLKFFILSFHGNIGYIDDSFNEGKVIFCRELKLDQYFNYVSNHPVIPQTLLGCLGCLCSQTRVLLWPNVHEYKLHVAQLVVVNICSGSPSEHIVRVLQRLTDEAAASKRSEDRPMSSIFKTGTSFFIIMGWMMLASMKLAVIRRIFEEQLTDETWKADNYNFLGQIWPDKQDAQNDMMHKIYSAVESILYLTAESVQEKDTKYLFLFLEIWTVYLEVVIPRAQHGTVVVDLWNAVIQKISKFPAVDAFLSVLEHLNRSVSHIRKADLSLTNHIIPVWRVTKLMDDKAQYFTDLWSSDLDLNETNFGGNDSDDQSKNCCSGQHGLDPWYNCVLNRLTHLDGDYQTDIIGLQS